MIHDLLEYEFGDIHDINLSHLLWQVLWIFLQLKNKNDISYGLFQFQGEKIIAFFFLGIMLSCRQKECLNSTDNSPFLLLCFVTLKNKRKFLSKKLSIKKSFETILIGQHIATVFSMLNKYSIIKKCNQ